MTDGDAEGLDYLRLSRKLIPVLTSDLEGLVEFWLSVILRPSCRKVKRLLPSIAFRAVGFSGDGS